MDHFIEITAFDDGEIPLSDILSKLMFKIHGYIVESKAELAISFPDYSLEECTLGARLRVHGSHAALEAFRAARALKGVYDYIDVNAIMPVPAAAKFAVVKRYQCKNNFERCRRRADKRGTLTVEQRDALFTLANQRHNPYPAIELWSKSSGMMYVQHIRQELADAAVEGEFNSFGLSRSGATVPFWE